MADKDINFEFDLKAALELSGVDEVKKQLEEVDKTVVRPKVKIDYADAAKEYRRLESLMAKTNNKKNKTPISTDEVTRLINSLKTVPTYQDKIIRKCKDINAVLPDGSKVSGLEKVLEAYNKYGDKLTGLSFKQPVVDVIQDSKKKTNTDDPTIKILNNAKQTISRVLSDYSHFDFENQSIEKSIAFLEGLQKRLDSVKVKIKEVNGELGKSGEGLLGNVNTQLNKVFSDVESKMSILQGQTGSNGGTIDFVDDTMERLKSSAVEAGKAFDAAGDHLSSIFTKEKELNQLMQRNGVVDWEEKYVQGLNARNSALDNFKTNLSKKSEHQGNVVDVEKIIQSLISQGAFGDLASKPTDIFSFADYKLGVDDYARSTNAGLNELLDKVFNEIKSKTAKALSDYKYKSDHQSDAGKELLEKKKALTVEHVSATKEYNDTADAQSQAYSALHAAEEQARAIAEERLKTESQITNEIIQQTSSDAAQTTDDASIKSQKNFQEAISSTNEGINRQLQSIAYLNKALDENKFVTTNKNAASKQLKDAFSNMSNYRTNPEAFNGLMDKEQLEVIWHNAYQEAMRQGVSSNILAKNKPVNAIDYNSDIVALKEEMDKSEEILKSAAIRLRNFYKEAGVEQPNDTILDDIYKKIDAEEKYIQLKQEQAEFEAQHFKKGATASAIHAENNLSDEEKGKYNNILEQQRQIGLEYPDLTKKINAEAAARREAATAAREQADAQKLVQDNGIAHEDATSPAIEEQQQLQEEVNQTNALLSEQESIQVNEPQASSQFTKPSAALQEEVDLTHQATAATEELTSAQGEAAKTNPVRGQDGALEVATEGTKALAAAAGDAAKKENELAGSIENASSAAKTQGSIGVEQPAVENQKEAKKRVSSSLKKALTDENEALSKINENLKSQHTDALQAAITKEEEKREKSKELTEQLNHELAALKAINMASKEKKENNKQSGTSKGQSSKDQAVDKITTDRDVLKSTTLDWIKQLGGSTDGAVVNLSPLANGLVKAAGAFKNANGEIESFTLKLNAENKIVDAAIGKNKTLINSFNALENAAEKEAASTPIGKAQKQLEAIDGLLARLKEYNYNGASINMDQNFILSLQKARSALQGAINGPNISDGFLEGITQQARDAAAVVEKEFKKIRTSEFFKDSGKETAMPNINMSNEILPQMIQNAQTYADGIEGVKLKIGDWNATSNTLTFTLEGTDGQVRVMAASVKDLNGAVSVMPKQIKNTSSALETLGKKIGGAFKQFSTAIFGGSIIYKLAGAIRNGVSAVKEIDLALTELKKVTDETDATYEKFLHTASKTSSIIGTTLKEFTNATADFARIGYSIEDASKLAEAASIYKNVGDGIKDVATASSSIISTMKAFDIQVEGSMNIVDKFNEVGNNFAIDSAGIGDALLRSASALAAAGNSLDESIGLITASNTIIQDTSVVGTALKTLSLRLRGAKADLEDAGLETDKMCTSVSTLRKKLLALTGNKVDIMLDENTFKNTTQILREMSQVWDEMTDINQAASLELMGGKRQANSLSAIIKNFDIVESVIEASLASENSAYEENLKVMDSIQGRINLFNNALQAMWNNFINADVIKFFVNLGTSIVETSTKLGGFGTIISSVLIVLLGKALKDGIVNWWKYAAAVVSGNAAAKTSLAWNTILGSSFIGLGKSISVATKSLWVFLKTTPAGWAIAAIAAISGVVLAVKRYKKVQQEASKVAADQANSYNETNKSLKDYQNQIEDLRGSLENGNLSEQDAYNAREKLITIQDELIDKYGAEKDAINLVTGAVKDQISAIDDLAKANAEDWITKNQDAAKRAEKYMTEFVKEKFYIGDTVGDTFGGKYSDFDKKIEELGGAIEWNNAWGVNQVIFKGTREEIQDSYQKLREWISKFDASNTDVDLTHTLINLSNKYNDIFDEDFETHKSNYNSYLENTAIASYTDQYGDIIDAQEKYKKAIAEGNQDLAKKAIRELDTAVESAASATGDNTHLANYFRGMFDDSYKAALNSYNFEDAFNNDSVAEGMEEGTQTALNKAIAKLDGLNGDQIIQLGEIEGTFEQEQGYTELTNLAKTYSLTVEQLIATLARLGIVQAGFSNIDEASYNISNYSDSIDTLQSNISAYQSALTSLESGTFTLSDYIDLIQQFPDLAKGVDASSKSFTGLGKNLKLAIKDSPDELVDTLKDLSKRLKETGKDSEEVDKLIGYLESIPTDSVESIARHFGTLTDKINGATRAQKELNDALNKDTNTGYTTRAEALQEMIDLMGKGAVGSESKLWDIAGSFFGEDNEAIISKNADALFELIKVRQMWYDMGDDKDGYNHDGIEKFIEYVAGNEGIQSKLQSLGATWKYVDGELDFDFSNAKIDDVAKSIGLTTDEFMDLLVQIGQFHNINWDNADDISTYISKLEENGAGAEERLKVLESSIESLTGKNISFDEIDHNGLKEILKDTQLSEEEIKTLLDLYDDLYVKVSDPLKLEIDNKTPEQTIKKLAEIEDLQQYIREGSNGLTLVDETQLRDALKTAGYSAEAIDILINKIKEYNNARVLVTSRTDPLGLDSVKDDAEATISVLDSLGIAIDNTDGQTIDIPVEDLVTNLNAAGYTPEKISDIIKNLSSTENGLGFKIDGEIDISEENARSKVEGVLNNLSADITTELNTKYEVTGGGQNAVATIASYWKNIPATAKTTYTVETRNTGYATGIANLCGTANASGTAFMSGDWGAQKTETALTGELGPELVVRGKKWFTVGENGAEFTNVKKGDIIFNHKQTAQLFKNGHVTSRGKAFAEGTAYASTGDSYRTYALNGAQSSGSNRKKSDTKNAEMLDFIEIKLTEIENVITKTTASIANFLDDTTQTIQKNNQYDALITAERNKSKTYNDSIKVYKQHAEDMLKEIPSEFRAMAQNGDIAITDFISENDKKNKELIENYREWSQKADDAEVGYLESIAQIAAYRLEQLQDIADDFQNVVGVIDSKSNLIESSMDLLEESGERLSSHYYDVLIANSKNNAETLKREKIELQKILDSAVINGEVEKGSDEWYEMVAAISEVDEAIIGCESNIEEYNNAINDIKWDNLDKFVKELDSVDSQISNLFDTISDEEKIVDDVGNWTGDGVASIGLLAQQMEIAQYKAQQYGVAIGQLQEDYQRGHYSEDEYNEKLSELLDNQWDSVKAYEQAKDAIVSLNKTRVQAVKDGVQKEIDAYKELINKKKEALQADKDTHDYERDVSEKQKDISSIKKQIAAMVGDNSASGNAKRKQLYEDLLTAQSELDETYYNHSIEGQQNALDQELENYEKNKQNEMDMLDEWLKNTEQVVIESIQTVQINTTTVLEAINETANTYGIRIADAITAPWHDGFSAITEYGSTFNSLADGMVARLNDIKSAQAQLINAANNTAGETIASIETNKSQITSADKVINTIPTTPNQDASIVESNPNAGMVSSISATLKNGSKGENVKALQTALNELGFRAGKIDGIFGANTKSAVRSFQASSSYGGAISTDGIVGPDTKKKFEIAGYASGSKKIQKDQLAILDELGEELQLVPDGSGRLAYIQKGTGILAADMTKKLMDLAIDPTDTLNRSKPQLGAPMLVNNNIDIDLNIAEVVHIDEITNDTLPNLTRAVKDQMDQYMKAVNSNLRRYTR